MLTTTVQGRTWNFSHAIGHVGPAGETFLWPYSVVTTDSDVIYVVNRGPDPKEGDGNKRVQPNFKRIGKWKLEDEFISDFAQDDVMWPVSLAVDEKGFLYCTDEIKNRVLKYTSEDEKVFGARNSDPPDRHVPGLIWRNRDRDRGTHPIEPAHRRRGFRLHHPNFQKWGPRAH